MSHLKAIEISNINVQINEWWMLHMVPNKAIFDLNGYCNWDISYTFGMPFSLDYYAILGVPKDATKVDICRAYAPSNLDTKLWLCSSIPISNIRILTKLTRSSYSSPKPLISSTMVCVPLHQTKRGESTISTDSRNSKRGLSIRRGRGNWAITLSHLNQKPFFRSSSALGMSMSICWR